VVFSRGKQRGDFFGLESCDAVDYCGALAIGYRDAFADGTLVKLVSHLFLAGQTGAQRLSDFTSVHNVGMTFIGSL
jgi:hypothetical protein